LLRNRNWGKFPGEAPDVAAVADRGLAEIACFRTGAITQTPAVSDRGYRAAREFAGLRVNGKVCAVRPDISHPLKAQ